MCDVYWFQARHSARRERGNEGSTAEHSGRQRGRHQDVHGHDGGDEECLYTGNTARQKEQFPDIAEIVAFSEQLFIASNYCFLDRK